MGAVACDFCRCEPGRCAKPADAQAKADAANASAGALRPDPGAVIACIDCGAPTGFVRDGCCDPGEGPDPVTAQLRIEGDHGQCGGPLAEPCTGGCGFTVAECECGASSGEPCHLCGGHVGDRGGDVVCQQCSDAINPPVTLCACGATPGEPCRDPCPVFAATASEPQPTDYDTAMAEAVNQTAAGYRAIHRGEYAEPQPGLAALHAAARLATDPGKAITEALMAIYSFVCNGAIMHTEADALECQCYREAWADAVYALAEAHPEHPLAQMAAEASGL